MNVEEISSMTGNPAQELTPSAIIVSWKSVLPGFEHTHHQLGNFTKIKATKVRFDRHAMRQLTEELRKEKAKSQR